VKTPSLPGPAANPAEHTALSRREFLKATGVGLIISIYPTELALAADTLPNGYFIIGTDGSITVKIAKVEYGQGVMTSLAQMVAEELDVPMNAMSVIMGDTRLCPADGDGGTYGSLSTRSFGATLRGVAARARAVLIELASQSLGVPSDQLYTADGAVISRVDPQVRVTYAELAGGKQVSANLSQTPRLKDYRQFTLSGQAVTRLDALEKVTGRAKYTADIRVPGMLYARILRPPAKGALLLSVDTSAAEQFPGARVIHNGSFVAVLHAQPDMAERALALIHATYKDAPAGPNQDTIHDYLMSRPPGVASSNQKGAVDSGEAAAVTKAEMSYYTPYVAHAPMESHAAVASQEATGLTVWASSQTPNSDATSVGAARFIVPYVGGGFGGKISSPQVAEAVQLAKAAAQRKFTAAVK
jgi:isoquinoline 1-oxidoreductase